jgi:hypothetical protein
MDTMGDHLCACTVHSGSKKTHDWTVDQLGDLVRTTHHTKTEHVTKSRGRHCGDIELTTYLANATGPVSLVLDLHIAHDLGILVDSEIVLSTSYGKTMVFINKNLINRDRLSTRPYQQRPLINKVDSW